ncbi:MULTISPECIES: thiol:disulfide interchange protein DsbG [Enterobacteriaceae]|uniref:thiol:disulfide interchange protein DsbG n=1 Tax=Enterobacteriaceae TaxID=543 RepID=UPI0015DBDFB6|nr:MULTISPECIES: thiol:disulfide interchange protein DsbG [unclassified Klebsiella]HAT3954629.1 thiol:disulfide interchange protein DsbG [Kluyvera ascorbata]BBQ84499.1 thiol:disulfide interchange protein DsbG [Klebsiella sp. WP3-W18-ESBL-02]BBR21551.1 thiol:disulfide interchange protein DsbG [Klebsiella sp. WP3-S18-ESBL-05]BBS92408.1 thiol:disulfide interchange protein DsbG [Klebsiella sp. WP7-S18-CRE-02]BBS97438.1 thiol:disulfide interchange protein DsbG [Klebsiella sp. WP7-S18-CRE-03]
MKSTLLMALTLMPALAFASTPLPDVVKRFSEQQNIKIIKEIDAPGGLKSWVGQYQDMGVTLFLTPDGKHVVSGYLYDDKGKNLSEDFFKSEIYIPLGREMWQKLNDAHALKEGPDSAERKVVVFADPFCPYCKTFWSAAQPWVAAGKVQLNTLLVAFLNPQSGRNATAILNAADPVAAWRDYELSGGKKLPHFTGTTPRETFNLLQQHQKLMDDLGANVTPAIYYMNDKNELQQVVGMPDEKQLIEMFGPRP